MNRRTLLLGLVLLSACATGLANADDGPTVAQPELPRQKLVIVTGDGVQHDFNVEVATSPQQQETGLMFRTSVPPDGGMLFDWGGVRDSTMWMRNTLVPLDMLFINPDGSIRHIAEDTTPQSLAMIPSGGAVRATLELAAGTAARLGLKVGDKVEAAVFGNLPSAR